MLIGAEWTGAADGRRFDTVNPFTGSPWADVPHAGAEDVDRAVRAARAALDGPWGTMSATARGKLIRRVGACVAERADELAVAETTDNGKLLREMTGLMRSLPDWYEFFGGLADKVEGTVPADPRPSMFAYTRHEPVGVVGAITAWNSPLLLLTMKLAAALAGGCTMVVKPAEQAPVSTLAFGQVIEDAGIPPGVFNVVTGDGTTGELLASHPGVDRVAFTGSTASGVKAMRAAAGHLAGVTLELGGKSPNIVFGDADLELAANGVMAGIFGAAGQTCIAGSRLLVASEIHDEFVERVAASTRAIKLGDPAAPDTEMGPLAFEGHQEKVLSYFELAAVEGAAIECGGRRPEDAKLKAGYFVEPSIITGVRNDMRVAQEEIFGPVLCVIPFATEEDAIQIANDTRYGLGAGVWTNDVRRAHRVAQRLRAGTIWVNCYRAVNYNVPFGGYGHSGIGRENGVDSVREYTETKSVWVNLAVAGRDPFVVG